MLLSSPLRRLLTAVVGLLVLVAAACGGNGLAAENATLVNQYRVANGIPPLPRSYELDLKAQAQAQRMADANTIFHSANLVAGVSPGWQLIGENVAMAGSVRQAQAALEASAPHRENLLNWAYSEMGIGAVQKGNRVYIAQVFVQR
jgi:uncharacterized protein YkwD